MLKKQNKEVSDILTQGQNLVDEIEKTLVKALQVRSLKAGKGENKIKKGEGMIKKFFGGGTSSKQTSLS